MGVVRGESVRRWTAVGAGVAVLCLLPAVVGAWPVGPVADLGPAQLRDRILASVSQPYQGFVATDGRLGLPALPELAEVSGLLAGSARLRAWYAAPDAWRVAELTAVGERDTYRAAGGRYQWDFERNLVTLLAGDQSVWLPGAADLVPPALARRLLGASGRVEPLPDRRVAGTAAAGVRLVPADPDTTVGRVDVWADPATGLPLRVEVAGAGATSPAFTSRFLQLRQVAPEAAALAVAVPDGAGFAVTGTGRLTEALAQVLPGALPGTLAGQARVSWTAIEQIGGAAAYGEGLSTMVVVTLPGRVGGRMLDAGRDAGGAPAPIPGAEAYELRTSLLSTLVVHADHPEQRRETPHAWLLAGLVEPDLLHRAATELVGGQR